MNDIKQSSVVAARFYHISLNEQELHNAKATTAI